MADNIDDSPAAISRPALSTGTEENCEYKGSFYGSRRRFTVLLVWVQGVGMSVWGFGTRVCSHFVLTFGRAPMHRWGTY